jgi:hypothetical protein
MSIDGIVVGLVIVGFIVFMVVSVWREGRRIE